MDTSKQIFETEKRKSKASEVLLKFYAIVTKNLYFKVYKEDGETAKYIGRIGDRNVCSCPSYYYGMKYYEAEGGKIESHYYNEHGEDFACKHIIQALAKRNQQ